MRCLLLVIKFLKRFENSIRTGIHPHRRDVRPMNDSVTVDDKQDPFTHALLVTVGAIRLRYLPLGLKIRQQGKMQLAVARVGGVAPGAVNRDPQELRAMTVELLKDLVVQGKLISTHRTPVGGIERKYDRPAAKIRQSDFLVRGAVQLKRWRCGSRRQS